MAAGACLRCGSSYAECAGHDPEPTSVLRKNMWITTPPWMELPELSGRIKKLGAHTVALELLNKEIWFVPRELAEKAVRGTTFFKLAVEAGLIK